MTSQNRRPTMSANQAKYPQLRFKGFTDPWEERKLGDITKISTGKLDANAMVENGKYDFYTSGIKKYRIDVAAFEGPSITIAGNGATVGYMHLADNKFNAYQRTYVLQEFLVDRSFIFSEIGNKLPKKIKQEARTGNIPYIVMDMLTELKLSIPQNNSEQQKIGSFFKQLDDTIDLHQRKLDLLKEQKKGYLQKMFPQNGSKFPQLRFAGFADAWEQRKLGELGKIYTGNTPKTSDLDNWTDNKEGHIWITPTDIDKLIMSDSDRHLSEQGWSKARKIPENSVLITSIASIGKNTINAVPVAFNQQINAIVPEKNDSYFILSAMIKDTARFASVAGQTATAIINKTTFEKFQIATPSYEEQQKIGLFFKQLDSTIALHQRKLDLLKEQKKGFLHKMFV